MRGRVNMTIDGQFGSTGKGLLNAYIGTMFNIDVAVSNAAPNAGHTFDVGEGKKTVFHLPVSGVLCTDSLIYLCAGAVIDMEVLEKEIRDFNCGGRVFIHPRAAIVSQHHRDLEQMAESGTTKLASTRKGVGQALAGKVTRDGKTMLVQDYVAAYPDKMLKSGWRMQEIRLDRLAEENRLILMEVPQGFDLSVNHGLSYPYCTSRDITVSSALNDAGVHPKYLGKVYASIRSFPIRVGNIYDTEGVQLGHSGPFWPDSDEKTWKDLGKEPELTTVTKRPRRVATFSFLQYGRMLDIIRPDAIFLNFMNYFDKEFQADELITRMTNVENQRNMELPKLFGFGPHVKDVHHNYEEVEGKLTGVTVCRGKK